MIIKTKHAREFNAIRREPKSSSFDQARCPAFIRRIGPQESSSISGKDMLSARIASRCSDKKKTVRSPEDGGSFQGYGL